MPQPTHRIAATRVSESPEIAMHVGFAFTGVGTVLLGAILPQLSAEWHLRDQDAGALLLVQFAAASTGSLLVRRNFWKTLSLGYGVAAAGAILIYLLRQEIFGLGFAMLGLGLGMAMTSTSLLIARRSAERRGAALAILNFCWSAGAVACPMVASALVRSSGSRQAFGALGLLLVPFSLLPLLGHEMTAPPQATFVSPPPGAGEWAIIGYFALLAFLYVGVEASIGNWMSTFATRVTTWKFVGGSVAVATFWAALLLGRAATAPILRLLSERRLYRVALLALVCGVLLLLLAHGPIALLAAAAASGLALAPLFPLILSLFLERIGASRNAGWVFCIAGLGGATLSWLTGIVSTHSGSLRVGLLVPGAAALLMLAVGPWRNRTSGAH